MPKLLDINDKEIFLKYYSTCCYLNSECNFTNMLSWSKQYNIGYEIIDDFLVVFAEHGGEAYHHFPIGKGDVVSVIKKLSTMFKEMGKPHIMKPIVNCMKEKIIENFGDAYIFEHKREYDDYVYSVDKLISLAGKKLHAKRNHFNNFIKTYNYTYNKISPNDYERCREFLKTQIHDDSELHAINVIFDNYDKLDVVGAFLEVDGQIIAVTVGEGIRDNNVLIHIEKANTDYKGVYAAINKLFLQNEWADKQYVNREEDMGDEGLRKAKLSYYPDMFIEKYRVKER